MNGNMNTNVGRNSGYGTGNSKVGRVLMITVAAVIIIIVLVVVIWAIVRAVKNRNKNTSFLISGPVLVTQKYGSNKSLSR